MRARREKTFTAKKPMSHKVEEGFEMVKASESNHRIMQVGAQRVSSYVPVPELVMYREGARFPKYSCIGTEIFVRSKSAQLAPLERLNGNLPILIGKIIEG